MTETTKNAPAPTKEVAPKNGAKRRGHSFQKGHHVGRPKGSLDRRYIAGQAAAQAMEHKAWDVVAALLTCTSWRARLESAKVVLSYSLGLPRQSLTIAGGVGDLARELSEALRLARERRAALDVPIAAQALLDAPEALPAPSVEDAPEGREP